MNSIKWGGKRYKNIVIYRKFTFSEKLAPWYVANRGSGCYNERKMQEVLSNV